MSLENLPDWPTILEWAQPFLIKLAVAAAIVLIGMWLASRIAGLIRKGMLKTRRDEALAGFVSKLVQIVLMVFVILAALGHLGVDTTAAAAIVGGSALAIGLSLQGQLASLAAGIMLIMFRPFRIGDFIEGAGVGGTVQEIQMVKTVLRTPNNQIVHIPNAQIWGSPITNYSTEPTRRIDLTVGVSYDADLRETRAVLEQVVGRESRILSVPEPVIAVTELADSSVNFKVRPWVNTSEYWAVLWDLTEAIKNALDDANIGIPYPQMDVHLHKQDDQAA
ncbi:MAG: mechanosensitive ion channel [Salinisphaeraceae bacterium]|nr:mechanosensitive ion channel [Salinisphaeraceae bacterium]